MDIGYSCYLRQVINCNACIVKKYTYTQQSTSHLSTYMNIQVLLSQQHDSDAHL